MLASSSSDLSLLLFTTDLALALEAEAAGVDSIIVDWERSGKGTRQQGYSTEINSDAPEDVARLAAALTIPVTVRIDAGSVGVETDVERALERGAGAIMLPMARAAREVERFVSAVAGRAETIVQIETQSLVDEVDSLRTIDWDHAYIGLNDLMISRGADWLWEPFLDGTVERIYDSLPGRSVGVAGVTVVAGGRPLPFLDLLQEMARLGCGLSFLRRTFKRERLDRCLESEVGAIRAAWQAAQARGPDSIRHDHRAFRRRLRRLRTSALPTAPLHAKPL